MPRYLTYLRIDEDLSAVDCGVVDDDGLAGRFRTDNAKILLAAKKLFALVQSTLDPTDSGQPMLSKRPDPPPVVVVDVPADTPLP